MTRRDRLILIVVAGVAVAGGAVGLGLSGRLGTTTSAAAAASAAADAGTPHARPEWITACNAPTEMKVAVDLEVQNGKVTDAAVKTAPDDAKVAACINTRVRSVKWLALSQPQHISLKF